MTARLRTVSLIATALLSSFALAACSGSDDAASSDSSTAAADAAKPDLSGLPATVAVVDGTKITKAEFVAAYKAQFQQLASQAQQSGQPVDQDALKKQTAEQMVNTQLLLAEADDRGYKASKKALASTLTELATSSGLASGDELLKSLAKQGIDKAEANRQLAGQVKLDQLVAAEGGGTEPTDKQLKDLYDQTVEQAKTSGSTTKIPPFAEVRTQLVEQLKTQEETTIAQKLVEDLRKDAKITINV